jgi:phosphoribosylformimino-5-aminoimidazole carboxamide ribonucleotide (ProFAR) isomerase
MGMKLAAAMAVMMLMLCGIFYWYYADSQERMGILRENAAKLEAAVQISEASIKMMETDIKRTSELNMQLQGDLQKAEQYGDELRATLQKHNLTMLALKKPAMIEQRMQDATNKIWADIAADTGRVGVQPVAPGTKNSNGN